MRRARGVGRTGKLHVAAGKIRAAPEHRADGVVQQRGPDIARRGEQIEKRRQRGHGAGDQHHVAAAEAIQQAAPARHDEYGHDGTGDRGEDHDLHETQPHLIHRIGVEIYAAHIGSKTPRSPHDGQLHEGLVFQHLSDRTEQILLLRRGGIHLFTEAEADHIEHAHRAADQEDDDIADVHRQSVQRIGDDQADQHVAGSKDRFADRQEASADADRREIGQPRKPAYVDHRAAAGGYADQEDDEPKLQHGRRHGQHIGDQTEKQPERAGKETESQHVFFARMRTVDQHGKGKLHQCSQLRNCRQHAEHEVACAKLGGKTDHGRRAAAADDAVRAAHDVAEYDKIQASADFGRQPRFVIDHVQRIVFQAID